MFKIEKHEAGIDIIFGFVLPFKREFSFCDVHKGMYKPMYWARITFAKTHSTTYNTISFHKGVDPVNFDPDQAFRDAGYTTFKA